MRELVYVHLDAQVCASVCVCVRACAHMYFIYIRLQVALSLKAPDNILFHFQPFIHQLGSEVNILPTDNNTTCLFLFGEPLLMDYC